MGSPAIGEIAMWTAVKSFIVAATANDAAQGKLPAGIAAEHVYRRLQNTTEIRGNPASCRIWAQGGAAALSSSWPKVRELLAERWRLHIVEAQPGGLYGGSILGTPYGYTGQLGDDLAAVQAGLLADLPAGGVGAAVGAADIDVTAEDPGIPLELTAGPGDLLTATRTRKTMRETARCAGEITIEFEVVVELPRDDPDSVPSAMQYLSALVGKLAHGRVGPAADLYNAGVAFMRYAMQPQTLTALDRSTVRSRAQADIVFTLDVSDTIELDVVAAVGPLNLDLEV